MSVKLMVLAVFMVGVLSVGAKEKKSCCPSAKSEVKADAKCGSEAKASAECETKKGDAQAAVSESKALGAQTTCPVMTKREINKKHYVDHSGKRIYVCCEGCVREVKKDPQKYIDLLAKSEQGVETLN